MHKEGKVLTDTNNDNLKLEDLKKLNDDELISYLKSSWGYQENEPIEVIGELKDANYVHYRIYNVRSIKALEYLRYPISDLDKKNDIQSNGIYSPPNIKEKIKNLLADNESVLVTCQLELSQESERTKHNNPLLVNINVASMQICREIDESMIIRNTDGILVQESIFNAIKINYEKKFKELDTKYKEHNKVLIEKKEKLDEEFEVNKSGLVLARLNLEKKYSIEEEKLQNKIDKKEKSLKKLEENIAFISNRIKEKQTEKDQLIVLINELNVEIERMEETMAKKLEKFRSFIKEKADQLLKLEFIDQEEYNDLLMIKKDNPEVNDKFLSFKDNLNSDYQKAISHIHSYLFNQDIIYPRYIIEDFMALVQTNDLIILAGESGSGKTNLVKSFAKAIGGKSFIIPVKPNWTSAEDLLGYYNPLEKKYLTTPFLDALLEAKNNPDIPYFICLDEMNLARVEYYFADFLSLLEERDALPEIQLYSDDESSHILSEFKNVLNIIESVKEKYQRNNLVDFVSILKDEEVNNELKRVFGFSDKDSLIKYHTDLRKMISGIINTPSSIEFPKNVRIIGAINIDETTHYLSPKILDRAHIMKFDSPLLYDWTSIADEIEENELKDHIVRFDVDELGRRENYPPYNKDDEFCKTITHMTKAYFQPMGIEVGLRTIRQGLCYREALIKLDLEMTKVHDTFINNFMLHKILPKMTFDGLEKDDKGVEKSKYLNDFFESLGDHIDFDSIPKDFNASNSLESMINKAKENESIINYWA